MRAVKHFMRITCCLNAKTTKICTKCMNAWRQDRALLNSVEQDTPGSCAICIIHILIVSGSKETPKCVQSGAKQSYNIQAISKDSDQTALTYHNGWKSHVAVCLYIRLNKIEAVPVVHSVCAGNTLHKFTK